MTDTQHFDGIIVGAGAAGLFCAAELGAQGRCVLVLEKNDAAGKKLLLTGGGKGNVTNKNVAPGNYIGDNPQFTAQALKQFTPDQMLRRLEAWHITVEEREHGQIFCTGSVAAVRDALLAACRSYGCAIRYGCMPERYSHAAQPDGTGLFTVDCPGGRVHAPVLVVATGSQAWPQSGADESCLHPALCMGHRVIPPRPVLAPLILPSESPLPGLTGISVPVRICCELPGAPAFTLPLLFTHKGISGPAALQISCYWKKGAAVVIDFLPGLCFDDMLAAPGAGKLSVRTLLGRHLPARLVAALLPHGDADIKSAELSRAKRRTLASAVHSYTETPLRNAGLQRAEACAGGVDTRQLCPGTLESTIVPGLYFCGEIIDVTGQLGGYNLHWAWASAFCTARAILAQTA